MTTNIRWVSQGERRLGACRESGAAQSCASDFSSLRLLVVDDLPVHRALLSGMLKILFPNAVVDEADDGVQAQVMLRRQRYDIVLSDWVMPNMDGLQLVSWLRSGETSPSSFVLFSAHDEVDEIASLFITHEIDGYLIKPFDQAAMKEVIAASVGNVALAA